MKTNYEFKSNIKTSRIDFSIKITLIFIILIVIFHIFLPKALPSFFLYLVKPFWSINIPDHNLQKPLSELNQDILISQFKIENEELKKMLGRVDDKKSLLAFIIKKPPFTAYDSLVLDVGKDRGVEVGNKVYAIGDILIGEIDQIYEEIAKVRLYSSYGQKYDVFVGENSIQVSATGRGSGSFEAIIPRDTKVSVGNKITIPEISNSIFGVINNIIIDQTKAFSTIIFSYPINIYEQKWVTISLKNKTQ